MLTLVPVSTLRAVSKSIRKASFRYYVRELLEDLQLGTDVEDYLLEHLRDQDIPFWIRKDFNREIGNDNSVDAHVNIISSSYSKGALNFEHIYEQPDALDEVTRCEVTAENVEQLFNELVSNYNYIDVLIGYSDLYVMLLQDKRYVELVKENETVFKQELKRWLFFTLEGDYKSTTDVRLVYAWLFFNCNSLGIEVGYDARVEKEMNEETNAILAEESAVLYEFLKEELNNRLK